MSVTIGPIATYAVNVKENIATLAASCDEVHAQQKGHDKEVVVKLMTQIWHLISISNK